MSLDRKIRRSASNADKLRELLDISNDFEKSTIDQIKSRHNFKEAPQVEDLVRLIQSVESVNQQLLIENKYLKDETKNLKANVLNLVNENSNLHKELKNVTVLEILNEIHCNPNLSQNQGNAPTQSDEALKEELHQSQLLINELQKKLELALKTKSKSGNFESNTLENLESDPFRCCSKCNEELEIKIRQLDSLKNEIEQLNKSKAYLKQRCEDFEIKENDLLSQVKRYIDLVKHMELEKNQALSERELFKEDKLNTDKKFASILREYDDRLLKEKEIIVENVEKKIKELTDQNQNLEERVFKQENFIDRLTRDKMSLLNEVESYKQKCNSIDVDTHHMAEKMRNKYMDVLRERDNLMNENKRVRHDYEQFVQQNDQDKFCLRNELNSTRNRLLEVEKDLISSKDQSIQLTEQITKLEADIVSLKHSKNSVENSRDANLKKMTQKYEERESQLVMAIEALQARYCITVKELEELVESQKKLINNLRSELKTCNEHLELLAIKYKNDVESLRNQNNELNIRLSKYGTRASEFEEQNTKHNELHERMKERLKDLSAKCQTQHEELEKCKANDTLMKTTNLQLMQEVSALKDQLKLLTIPTRNMSAPKRYSQADHSYNSLNNMINATSRIDVGTLNTVRSAIENSIYSMK